MRESEQFDDLTAADEHMPPPEMATMSLEDYHAGSTPDFSPIHENEDDDFDVSGFDIPKEYESVNEEDYENEANGMEGYQYEGSFECPRCKTWLTEGDLDDAGGKGYACPNCGHLFPLTLNENTFSFFGTESYSLPKN
jgi:DNA-directed RNA polymerase subunit RPC12/RpoP